tara:strand:+ start:493 stop:1194 length:702 start_codon:yes stop_codon:yes gene_type:complete
MKNKKSQNEAFFKKKELTAIQKTILEKSSNPEKVKIIAVTKNRPYQAIEETYNFGIKDIGENKIQELENKISNKKLPLKLRIHFIGRLQSNKIKRAIKLSYCIQSVHSSKLAYNINKEAKKIQKKQKIYLQINIGKDENKQGFLETEIIEKYKKIRNLKNINILGIMTILPKEKNNKEIKKFYTKMAKISLELQKHDKKCKEISMGMSGDYACALECGATNIRIGTKIYANKK